MEHTKDTMTFELSDTRAKEFYGYGNLILNGKVFARDIHRDHAIDVMRRWNSHDNLLEACEDAFMWLAPLAGSKRQVESVNGLAAAILKGRK